MLHTAMLAFSAATLLIGGCVESRPRRVYVERREAVYYEHEEPVFEASSRDVVRIEVEPAPVERVYIYEQGYPPGCYVYGGYYYYGGYRYRREVFVTRYVEVNVREGRYVDVERNRYEGRVIEERHRTEFVRYGDRHESHPSVQRAEAEHRSTEYSTRAREHTERTARPLEHPDAKYKDYNAPNPPPRSQRERDQDERDPRERR